MTFPDNNSDHHNNKQSSFLMKAVAIASLGGILFGYDLGVVYVKKFNRLNILSKTTSDLI